MRVDVVVGVVVGMVVDVGVVVDVVVGIVVCVVVLESDKGRCGSVVEIVGVAVGVAW